MSTLMPRSSSPDTDASRHMGNTELSRFHAIDVGVDVWRGTAKGREYAFQARICIRRRDKIPGGGLQDCSTYIGPVLKHHLETARAADAVHRRRLDRDDEGVLDPGESLIDGRQNAPGRLTLRLPFLERIED